MTAARTLTDAERAFWRWAIREALKRWQSRQRPDAKAPDLPKKDAA